MPALLGYRLRQEGDAEPGAAEFGDEVDLTAAGDDARLEALTAASVKDDPVQGEAGLKEDERRVPQFAKRRAWPAGEGVIDGKNCHKRIAPH